MATAAPSSIAREEVPYVGLTHFTEADADRFFGRETECGLIIGNLRAARLTLLYAESGVGKSSALRAGVVARLRRFAERDMRNRGAPRLLPVVFSTWSGDPLAGLLRAIAEAAAPYLPQGGAPELPEGDLEGTLEAVGKALDATVLVILDQFEEYFLYTDPAPAGRTVADQVAACVNRPDLRANFLISIREDSYARLGDLFRGKLANVYGNFLHLDFLDRAGAREAIEKPLEQGPFEAEPELVAAVLSEVGRGRVEGSDGAVLDGGPRDRIETTYLQLVMKRLWEEEAAAGSRLLRLETLRRLGGTEAIIGSHLDRAMEGTGDGEAGLDQRQRLVAATIFRFLVTSGGTKIALTAGDLADLSEVPLGEIEPVLQHLSSSSLHILRPVAADDGKGEVRFEIFHDALAQPIRDWRHRVERAERQRERAEKRAAEEAAAEAERREERERRRKRLALGALGVALLVLVLGAVAVAVLQSRKADQREAEAQSVRAAGRIGALAEVPTFGQAAAALASVEAYRISPTTDAREDLLGLLQLNPGMPTVLSGHTRTANAVAFWPGSRKLASGGGDDTVRLWGPHGEELGTPLVNPSLVLTVAVSKPSAGGRRVLAAGLANGSVRLWRLSASGKAIAAGRIAIGGQVWGLGFDPRSPRRLALGSGGRIALWNVADPSQPTRVDDAAVPGTVNDLAFAPGAGRLFVASAAGGFAWRVGASGRLGAKPVQLEDREALSAAAAPGGSWAFGGTGRIALWDGSRRRRLQLRQPGAVLSLAFARGRDGRPVLASAGYDDNVTTWDVASGRPFGPPRTHLGEVTDLAAQAGGRALASAGGDQLVKVWPLAPTYPLALTVAGFDPPEAGGALPEALDSANSGGRLATAQGPGGVSIWSLDRVPGPETVSHPRTRIPGFASAVAYRANLLAVGGHGAVTFWDTGSRCKTMPARPCRLRARLPVGDRLVSDVVMRKYGGRLLLAASASRRHEGLIELWDVSRVAGNHPAHRFRPLNFPKTKIFQLALCRQHPVLAAAAEDGKMRVWNVSDPGNPVGSRLRNSHGNEDQPVRAVAFSPDGRTLASGGDDQQVVFWSVNRDGSKVESTSEHLFQSQAILSLAFSPNGKLLASGNADGNACIYTVGNHDQVGACLHGHFSRSLGRGGITTVRFATLGGKDGFLLTGGIGQPVVAWNPILWNLHHSDAVDGALHRDACAFAGRNLHQEEWEAIFKSTKLAGERTKTCSTYRRPKDGA